MVKAVVNIPSHDDGVYIRIHLLAGGLHVDGIKIALRISQDVIDRGKLG